MFCQNCGTEIPDDSSFCFKCGASTNLPTVNLKPEPDVKTSEDRLENPATTTANPETATNDIAQYNAAVLAKTKAKKRRTVALISSGIALLLITVLVIFSVVINKSNNEQVAAETGTETTVEEPSNTSGNTTANAMSNGFATMQNNTIYYIQDENGDEIIKSMDLNGESEQIEYTFNDWGFSLNVIGKYLYFVSYKLDENNNVSGSYVSRLTIGRTYSQKIYSCSGKISKLYVTEDKMYFIETYEDGEDKLIAVNTDGSEANCIVSKTDLFGFLINDSYIYYQSDYQGIRRCDFSGNHTEKIYSSSNTSCSAFCVADSKLYLALYTRDDHTIVKSMDLDGSNQTQLFETGKKEWISELNVVNGVIYYIDGTLTEDYEEYTGSGVYCRNLDGSDMKTIATSDVLLSQLNICDQWLFYYDSNKGRNINIKLSTI